MGCSQNEASIEEGDAMDWYEDDERRKQWEEVSSEEEKKMQRKTKEMPCILRFCKRCQSSWPPSA